MDPASRVYLDWNSTTPPLADVLDTMRDVGARTWGNPSSIHGDGRAARAVVEDARAAVADLCAADARDVVYEEMKASAKHGKAPPAQS